MWTLCERWCRPMLYWKYNNIIPYICVQGLWEIVTRPIESPVFRADDRWPVCHKWFIAWRRLFVSCSFAEYPLSHIPIQTPRWTDKRRDISTAIFYMGENGVREVWGSMCKQVGGTPPGHTLIRMFNRRGRLQGRDAEISWDIIRRYTEKEYERQAMSPKVLTYKGQASLYSPN